MYLSSLFFKCESKALSVEIVQVLMMSRFLLWSSIGANHISFKIEEILLPQSTFWPIAADSILSTRLCGIQIELRSLLNCSSVLEFWIAVANMMQNLIQICTKQLNLVLYILIFFSAWIFHPARLNNNYTALHLENNFCFWGEAWM